MSTVAELSRPVTTSRLIVHRPRNLPIKNQRRMALGAWAMAKKDLIFADLLPIVNRYLGDDVPTARFLSESAARVLSWVNGKDSSWMTSTALTSLASLSPEPSSASSGSSDNGLSSSDSEGSPTSSPTKQRSTIPCYVHRLKPRLELSSLDRAPKSRTPMSRTLSMIR
ncbi:hypothetical protein DIPPA_15279 [Diplonema papillatum]|nr:hypothetical protein DIPPA_15279 [Diplonema papillatum]|eukprot:gene19969-30719_t